MSEILSLIKKNHEEQQNVFAEFKRAQDKHDSELAQLGQAKADTIEKVEKLDNTLNQLDRRMEKLNVSLNRTGSDNASDNGKTSEAEQKHAKAFADYIVKSQSYKEKDYIESVPQLKELVIGDLDKGGYTLPPAQVGRVIEELTKKVAMRKLASTVKTKSQAGVEHLVISGDFAMGGVGDEKTAIVDPTTTPTFAKEYNKPVKFWAKPICSDTFLEDSPSAIMDWLNKGIVKSFTTYESQMFLLGDTAKGEPQGLLTLPVGTGTDKIEDIASGAANGYALDNLLDIIFALDDEYINDAKFLTGKTSVKYMRKLKDNDGHYYFNYKPGGASFFEYDVLIDSYMPNPTAGNYGLVFGNFKEGYEICDRAGVKIRKREYLDDFWQFYTTKRTGGMVIDGRALKRMKIDASA
jgi:HK97 family phage major capsid protein